MESMMTSLAWRRLHNGNTCSVTLRNCRVFFADDLEGRTVKNISALLEKAEKSENEVNISYSALNTLQLYMMDEIKKYAHITTLNLPFRINIKPDVDLAELS